MKGYDPSYLDHLSAVLQRVFVDLGVLRRRQKHQGARYAQWVERLLQMVVTDGDGTEDTTAELTDSKVEKLVFMTNYYNAQADRNNAQADRKIILQESPGKNRGGKFFSVYRRFRLLGRWRRQAWPQRDFFHLTFRSSLTRQKNTGMAIVMVGMMMIWTHKGVHG